MELRAIAIDVGWLITLQDGDPEQVLQKIHILTELDRHGVSVLFDAERHIISEYDRHIDKKSLQGKFVALRIKRGPVEHFSGKLAAARLAKLRADGFHEKDIPYVGVAASTGGGAAFLTHERKHRERADLVKSACGVIVPTEAELLGLLDWRGPAA